MGKELEKFCAKCKQDGSSRVIKCSIKNEQLCLEEHREPNRNWEEDYYRYVNKLVDDNQPCYLLFRFDTRNSFGVHEWLIIVWSPESSNVRDKMLYASTKASFKKFFGTSSIVSDYFATTRDELSLSCYKKHLARKVKEQNGEKDESLMTNQELDLMKVRREEALQLTLEHAKSKTLPEVDLPMTEEAFDALFDLKEGLISYVQLSIDLQREEITLEFKEGHKEFDVKDLPNKVPVNNARYHLILYPHNHENNYVKSIIFVYSVGRDGCTVKERMLYSSCKSSLVSAITDSNKFGIQVTKKLEIDDPNELELENLLSELHPKKIIPKQLFDKPKAPAKRGPRRLVKNGEDA